MLDFRCQVCQSVSNGDDKAASAPKDISGGGDTVVNKGAGNGDNGQQEEVDLGKYMKDS